MRNSTNRVTFAKERGDNIWGYGLLNTISGVFHHCDTAVEAVAKMCHRNKRSSQEQWLAVYRGSNVFSCLDTSALDGAR